MQSALSAGAATSSANLRVSVVIYPRISSQAGFGGSISPSGSKSLASGESQSYTVTPQTGYQVADVLVDGVSQGAVTSYQFSKVTASHTISATFTPSAFTISASAGVNGTITPSGSASVTLGDGKAYTVAANQGYKIFDVQVDKKSVGAATGYNFSNVTANHTITASFVTATTPTKVITASVVNGTGGTISPTGNFNVISGGYANFTFYPDSGYHVGEVKVDGAPIVPTPTTSYKIAGVTANRTISVRFDQNQ